MHRREPPVKKTVFHAENAARIAARVLALVEVSCRRLGMARPYRVVHNEDERRRCRSDDGGIGERMMIGCTRRARSWQATQPEG